MIEVIDYHCPIIVDYGHIVRWIKNGLVFTKDHPKATALLSLNAKLATALAKGTPSYSESIRSVKI